MSKDWGYYENNRRSFLNHCTILSNKEKGSIEELMQQVYDWLWDSRTNFTSDFYLKMKECVRYVYPFDNFHYSIRVRKDYLHYFVSIFGLDQFERERIVIGR